MLKIAGLIILIGGLFYCMYLALRKSPLDKAQEKLQAMKHADRVLGVQDEAEDLRSKVITDTKSVNKKEKRNDNKEAN